LWIPEGFHKQSQPLVKRGNIVAEPSKATAYELELEKIPRGISRHFAASVFANLSDRFHVGFPLLGRLVAKVQVVRRYLYGPHGSVIYIDRWLCGACGLRFKNRGCK